MAVTGSGDSFTHITGNHEITTLGYSNVFLSKKIKKKKKKKKVVIAIYQL